jgi:hypothetical protein
MSFLTGTGSNVIADIVFWILLGITFWATSAVLARRFSRFFGLNNSRRLAVYLSNLYDREKSLRAEGYTISLHELRAAQSVDQLFGSAPLRLPDLVRGFVDSVWLRGQIRAEILVSPLDSADADLSRNLIVVGSSSRNSVRARYLSTGLPTAAFPGEDSRAEARPREPASTTVVITRDGSQSERTYPSDMNIALLEKCVDPYRGLNVFFCLGLRGDTSWAACEHLVRDWKKLARQFGDGGFLICLGFPFTHRYMEVYREPTILESQRGSLG